MSLIDPSAIPFADMHPEQVQGSALMFSNAAGQIRDGGAGVLTAWQALPSSLEVTGTAHIYSVMDVVGTNTRTAGDGLDSVSKALAKYGDDLLGIKIRFETVYATATAFVSQAKSFGTKVEGISSGYTLGITLPEAITSWDQDPTMVAKNNALIHAVAQIEADWLDAQERCATAIRAAAGLGPTMVSEEKAAAKAMRSSGDLKTPWGATQDRKESCSEKAITFQTHFTWDGVIVGFGGGLLKSVGALTGTWDGKNFLPYTAAKDLVHGDWSGLAATMQHSQDVQNAAGLGLLHLVSGLARPPWMSPPIVEGLLGGPAGALLPASVRNGLRDWNREDGSAVYGMVGGLVGLNVPQKWWDPKAYKASSVFSNWTENPGGAAGQSVANIATFFIPGGEAASGTKAALEATEGAADATKLVKVGDLSETALTALKSLDHDGLSALNPHLTPAEIDHLFMSLHSSSPELGSLELHVPETPSVPHESVPHETTPHESAPHESAPHETSPTETAPHETSPTETAPHESAPHETSPTDTAPHESTPHESTPTETTPHETAPHDPASTEAPAHSHDPADTTPHDGQPQDGQPQDGQPQDGQPQDGQPQDGQPQDGQPHDGQPQDGQPHDGQPQDGQPHDADPAQQQPTQPPTPPRYEPQPHDLGPHSHELEPGKAGWNPGTTNPTRLGRLGEALTAGDIADRGGEIIKTEPQIEVPGAPKWFKPDFLVKYPNGDLVLVESKMGDGAGFTPNQHIGYSEFDKGGNTLVGRTVRIDERLRTLLRDEYGIDDPVVARVETYRWNVDVVPDADLAGRALAAVK